MCTECERLKARIAELETLKYLPCPACEGKRMHTAEEWKHHPASLTKDRQHKIS